uniref:Uncharacterized protein n=1 Tax=Spermophilus dauricus TaxID=99837 RepID=A0A8C9UUS1_SPEDA
MFIVLGRLVFPNQHHSFFIILQGISFSLCVDCGTKSYDDTYFPLDLRCLLAIATSLQDPL